MTREPDPGRAAYHHEPVMRREVVELLGAVPDGVVVDATVGGEATRRRCWTVTPGFVSWGWTAIPPP